MMNNKELFEWKRKQETIKAWDENCEKKAAGFITDRNNGDFESCFHKLCENMDVTIGEDRFIYFFDFDFRFTTSIANIMPDYTKILDSGLADLKYEGHENDGGVFAKRYNSVVDDLILLTHRISDMIEDKGSRQYGWFGSLEHNPANGFEEAMQRVLFLNQLIWQTGSRLVGLGRLDMELYPYYIKDKNNGAITRETAKEIIMDALRTLHKFYWFKSSVMLGDTGQVMVLGGTDSKGGYEANELTYLFLECVMEHQESDPKIVLRVNSRMPRDLMELALQCMETGCGSPLLSNDERIIPLLEQFGVEPEDARRYATSACWEPLVAGKSSSPNNQASLCYVKALNNFLMEEKLREISTFEELVNHLLPYIRREVIACERNMSRQVFWRNTLYSVFVDGCKSSGKDIVDGGAKYHNIGMTTVGLGNMINALINIKDYVFDRNEMTLTDVKMTCFNNYQGKEQLADELKNMNPRYGQDDPFVIDLTNRIIRYVSLVTKDFRTGIGGRLKFGLSSPSYIMDSGNVPASFDGRKAGEPFIVHISNENISSYTELINYAGALDYGDNRFNGNVVDFFVNPSFIQQNRQKMAELMMAGIKVGFFQLQMNVVGSEKLVEAKAHPEQYQNLIVRVWGFSAYFVDLSEDYQNLLINRARAAEGYVECA
jgi:formate C-acetyltransferase